jgi:hypothetical protein
MRMPGAPYRVSVNITVACRLLNENDRTVAFRVESGNSIDRIPSWKLKVGCWMLDDVELSLLLFNRRRMTSCLTIGFSSRRPPLLVLAGIQVGPEGSVSGSLRAEQAHYFDCRKALDDFRRHLLELNLERHDGFPRCWPDLGV